MPDVCVRNDTPSKLNIAFRFVAPAAWANSLDAGKTWQTHLAGLPFTVEVRLDETHNRFSAQDSWATAGNITGGYLAGAASLTLGALSVAGMMTGVLGEAAVAGAAATVPLMKHAIDAGQRFAQNASGMVLTVPGVSTFSFSSKTYAIRFDEHSGYSLWDVDRNVRL